MTPASAFKAYPQLSNSSLRIKKRFAMSIVVPETIRNLFDNSNGDCLAQDRPRELKLVSLEPSVNEKSEYLIKIFYHV
jgi:hypothetical protein